MHEIHMSDIGAFKQCRRRWNWTSPLRSNLAPVVSYAPFIIGRIIHTVQEYRYSPNANLREIPMHRVMASALRDELKSRGKLMLIETVTLRDQVKLVRGMLNHYVLWASRYAGAMRDQELEFVYVEKEFRVPLRHPDGAVSPNIVFAGRFDGIARHLPTGKLWLWEMKTCRSIPERYDQLVMDEQASGYCIAAQDMLGAPVEGIIYTLMLKKLPRQPVVLADGMLSKNRAIDTTPEAYAAAVRMHHGADAPALMRTYYQDMIAHLAMKCSEKPYFLRVPVRRTQEELRRFRAEMWAVAHEMVDPVTPIYATAGWQCSRCSFKQPCLTYNKGDDAGVAFQLAAEFHTKEATSGSDTVVDEETT